MALCLFLIVSTGAIASGTKAPVSSTAPSPAPALESPKAEKPLTMAQLKTYVDDCNYHIPPRFTPDAREYYCACTMKKLDEHRFTQSHLNQLKNSKSWVASNPLFESFASNVMAPCLDFPTKQIEYLSCLLDSSNDYRIGKIQPYCNCTTKKIVNYVKKNAAPDILLSLGRKNTLYRDPIEAMWNNINYIKAADRARDECILAR
jgi:hypothetical protein